jgi:3-deoxy-7-phosphoheptulonate synthase
MSAQYNIHFDHYLYFTSTQTHRATANWRGLINDPGFDGSFQINQGLRIARNLLQDLTSLGVPVGLDLPDAISLPYITDCKSCVQYPLPPHI